MHHQINSRRECGKDTSDQALDCPNCGYPIKRKKNRKIILAGFLAIILILFMVLIAVDQVIIKPGNTYNEAVLLYDLEKYDEAFELFSQIPDFKDASAYLDRIVTQTE